MNKYLKVFFAVLCVLVMPAVSLAAQPMEVIFGHGFGPNTPHHRAAIKFKEFVEEKSGGKMTVSLFHSNQLGTARELFEGLQLGSPHVTTIPTARISGFAPQLQIFDLPFLFPDDKIRLEVLDGAIGKELLATLSKQGVVGAAFYIDGLKQMTANKPLHKLDDFKGIKFRTMESPIIMEQYRLLGAQPVPVEYAELYNALQMKVVDAQENPINQIHDNKLYEVQKYMMITDHAMLAGVFLYSQDWYKSLPDDLRNIIDDATKVFIENQRSGVSEVMEVYLKNMKEKGLQIEKLSAEEIQAFAKATLPVYDLYIKDFGSDIIKKIQSLK